jgi:hypothetical protein
MNNSNRLHDDDRAIHDWYRFVLSFPPHLVRDGFNLIGAAKGDNFLDPFAGTGTALVEAQLHGMSASGYETNPICRLAATVKTAHLNADIIRSYALSISHSLPHSDAAQFTLPPEQLGLLIKNSISPQPLSECLRLVAVIAQLPEGPERNAAFLIAARTAVLSSNLRFRPNPTASGDRGNVLVMTTWHGLMLDVAADLHTHPREYAGNIMAIDAREIQDDRQFYDRVFTSPPYPMEIDYTAATRLESVLLGYFRTIEDARAVKQNQVTSHSRGVYAADNYGALVADVESIADLSAACAEANSHKSDGFTKQYPKIVREYFGGMRSHFASLKHTLAPDARLGYVVGDQNSYGVLIETGKLLAELAVLEGYSVDGLVEFRQRQSKRGETIAENILLLRWD